LDGKAFPGIALEKDITVKVHEYDRIKQTTIEYIARSGRMKEE